MLWSISVDMWSVGCIMAELLTRKVLFAGVDRIHLVKYVVCIDSNDMLMLNVMLAIVFLFQKKAANEDFMCMCVYLNSLH